MSVITQVEVRGKFLGVSFSFYHRIGELNLGHQVCSQIFLSAELTCWPREFLITLLQARAN